MNVLLVPERQTPESRDKIDEGSDTSPLITQKNFSVKFDEVLRPTD